MTNQETMDRISQTVYQIFFFVKLNVSLRALLDIQYIPQIMGMVYTWFCCISLTHIFQGYFIGTGAIIGLPPMIAPTPVKYPRRIRVDKSHWDLTTNVCLPLWAQAFSWTNVDLLPTTPCGTKFNEILIEPTFSFMQMNSKCLKNGSHFVPTSCINMIK